jgi:WD40 repeat protein
MEPAEGARLVRTLAEAMHLAHRANVIHRDLKPANVLLASDGTPRITDFGLAKKLDEGSRTQTGAILGTPSYMAPEQAEGKRGEMGPATDVYALGAILYEMLTGRPPFKAATPFDTLMQVVSEEPVAPRQLNVRVPVEVETIALKCLHKNPARRYVSAEELARDLERWLIGEPIHARPASRWERLVKWIRRRPEAAALLGVSIASFVTLFVFAVVLWQNAEGRAAAVKDRATALEEASAARLEAEEKRIETRRQEKLARTAGDSARRTRYAADMHFAHAAWAARSVSRMLPLLDRYRDEKDLRGFEWDYLWRLCHAEKLSWQGYHWGGNPEPSGQERPVLVALSPDGRTLATASLDSALLLWDATKGKLLRTLAKPDGAVASLAFGGDGKSLEVVMPRAGKPGKAPAWMLDPKLLTEVKSGKRKPTVQGLLNSFRRQSIPLDGTLAGPADESPLGRLLAPVNLMGVGKEAKSVMVGGLTLVKGGIIQPWCLAESADHRWLAIGGLFAPFADQSQEGVILLWDRIADQPKDMKQGLVGVVSTLAFSSDSRTLASGGSDGEVKLWALSARGMTEQTRARAHTSLVFTLAFTSDGNRLFSAGADNLVVLTDITDGKQQAVFQGHVHPVSSICLARDDRTLISAGTDGGLKLWDCASPPGTRSIKGFLRDIVLLYFSVDGNLLVAIDEMGVTRRIEVATRREVASAQLTVPAGLFPRPKSLGLLKKSAIAVTTDGKAVAFAPMGSSEALVCDPATGKMLHKVALTSGQPSQILDCSPDGRLLAASTILAKNRSEVALWDVGSGKKIPLTGGVSEGPRAEILRFSPNGKLLASGGVDRIVRLWDVAARKQQHAILARPQPLSGVAFSPDTRLLAVAAGDNLTITEVQSGREVLTWRGYHGQVSHMVFSPDGRRLLTAIGGDELGRGGGIKVWDVATGQELLSLGGASDVVTCIAFSPDGKRLASSHTAGGFFVNAFGNKVGREVRIWDAGVAAQRPDEV